MKKCSGCQIIKPHVEFNKNKLTCDGFGYYCKKCRKKEHFQVKLKEAREPWRKYYKYIRIRCTSKWNRYCNIGIKNYLTVEDVKIMWFRDKAYDMKRPSVDRRDNDKHYIPDNCRFVELRFNIIKGQTIDRKGISRKHKLREKICWLCKSKFMSGGNTARYCKQCRPIMTKENHRKYWVNKGDN